MSGVPAPQFPITRPFGASAPDPVNITLPIPVNSQIAINPAYASFVDGFPPTTMLNPQTQGGIPPYGQDMNGILYMLSAYCALIQAGQRVPFNAAAAAAFGGYALGAQVASTVTPGLIWTNCVNANANNPDTTPAGWAASVTLYAVDAPAAGIYDNVLLPGASDFITDVNTAAGDVQYLGFIAQRDGQLLTLSNTGANLLTIGGGGAGGDDLTTEGGDFLVTEGGDSLVTEGGGASGNIRTIDGGIAVLRYGTITIQFVQSLNLWIVV